MGSVQDAAKLRDELKDMIPPEKDNHFVLGHLDNSSNTCTKVGGLWTSNFVGSEKTAREV